jgi:PHP family Zn ribbon phosphoesterase
MNRMLSKLDGIRLVSNSDAHSPAKLGREATVFDCDRTYAGMARAMKTGEGLTGTVEFFPEEGKYHYDGHRNCGVVMHPDESRKRGGICPECGKKMTLGVMYRVRELADRDEPRQESYRSIVPLADIIAAVMGRGVNTKGVREAYFRLLDQVGPEFHVLLDAEPAAIERASSVGIADAIKKMRRGEVELSPGYDGVFGTVRVGA